MMMQQRLKLAALVVLTLGTLSACSTNTSSSKVTNSSSSQAKTTSSSSKVLQIANQGLFSAGGTVTQSEGIFEPTDQWEETGAGQTSHVDHANVFYQVPQKANELPMVFLHGYGQSRMGWQTTPDGRAGWANYFLRQGHSVYLVDQPHRGEAGQTSIAGDISTKTLDQRWYTQFRIGRWANGKSNVYQGSQFPNDEASLNQFFRQMTPDTGMKSDMGEDFDNELVARDLAATVDEVKQRTGKKALVVTHSQGGGAGWTAARYTDNIAGIIAIEPGNAPSEDSDEFKALLAKKVPVTFYYGDYIDNGDEDIAATAIWQGIRQNASDFVKQYQQAGGKATLVDLPKEGIKGNTHFMFQDKNSDTIAKHVENWIAKNAAK
ncbi:alpha/beta hydrolase [Ligilactobacillus apodemi]|uniref:alpha/beta hydrolase n=1 Tax=Ligilactobacillus apodemi TaxID=307126 RepID=UPI00214C22CB|nr:alpha/beta fold hydrolase [Ligilactobacillus apodemi]MCR1901869.1 alpha/beta fold hydrolase [Ligilactobacillus apodemi]